MSVKPISEDSSEMFRSVVENSLAGMYIVQEGRFKYVNPSLIQMLGYERPDELMEVPFQQIIHPEDRPLTVTSGEACREKGGSMGTRCAFRALRKDASSVLVEMRESHAAYLGKPANVGNLIEIANQKRTEEELRKHRHHLEELVNERTAELREVNGRLQKEIEERKRAEETVRAEKNFSEDVINSLPGIFYLFDQHGRFLRWNRNFEEVSEYSPEEIVEMSAHDFFEGEHKQVASKAIDQVFTEGRTLVEANFASKTGKRIPTYFTGVRTVIDGTTYLAGVGIDITERRQAMEAFKESEEKLAGILRSLTDNLIMADENLSIVWANDVTRDFFGGEVVGGTCYNALHGYSEPCEVCPMRRCFQEGTKVEWETQFTGADGIEADFWCTATVAARHEDGRPKRVLGVCRNISEKKVLEAEAMRASQLASLGELAAGVAHEINNPINGIINYAQMLVDQYEEEGQAAEIPKRIIKEGDRVAKIVRNLLSFARERTEGRGPARVRNILADSLGLAQRQIRKDGIQLRLDVPADLPRIRGHSQQIQQVFLNVLSNARYALNKKYPEPHDDKVLEIQGELAEMEGRETVRVSFLDKGPGIPGNIIDKVCDPFFSTKPRGEGTGLGLSISYGIIKDHQGSLRIRSVEGKQTEVLIDLPLFREGQLNDGG